MKNYIVGAFTPDTWAAHGRRWVSAAQTHKGKAGILVLQSADKAVPFDGGCDGIAKVLTFDGTITDMFRKLAEKEGVFLFMAPHVRLQAEPVEAFEVAKDKLAVVERINNTQGQPFNGSKPVYESYWAAPYDLIDLLCKVVDTSIGTGCKPVFHDTNYISYFAEFFPWFRHTLPFTEFLPIYDAQFVADYYADPQSLRCLTAVGLDKPEAKKAGVIGSVVRPAKPSLTTDPEKPKMSHDMSSDEQGP